MCGIAGGTGIDSPARRAVLESQLRTLERRGPDSWGFLPGDRVVVGQTRLAVIDVAHGNPPLTDESGQLRVALNGEIYNFREIRDQLVQRGHDFATGCDTEVIAHLAEELSAVELARSLNGMFAFAVSDERSGALVLGRDRLGKKPLYYWHDGNDLVFGSEIKALLSDPRVPRRLRPAAIPAYLLHGYVPTPDTFFEGISSLPPGSVLTFTPGSAPVVERYWDVPVPRSRSELVTGNPQELVQELREHLRTAVHRRLVSDVPIGAFLSGGVDSSLVVALMAQESPGQVRTFSIGFEEEEYDERSWARLVAERYGTDHVEHVVRPDAAALLEEVLDACDQPLADSAALPTWLLSQAARQDVTVALSGDGGDELFAGYERFAAGLLMERLSPAAPVLRRVSRGVAALPLPERPRRAIEAVGAGLPDGYERLVAVFSPEQVHALTGQQPDALLADHRSVWQESEGAPTLTRLLHLNLKTYLLDALLVKADRMSMAHGLEVRSPLLDVDLLAFAFSVAPEHHLRGRSLKLLLKQAARGLVPDAVLDRPKKGFGVPLDAWFRGELRDEAHRALLTPGVPLHEHLDVEALRTLLHEHETGRRDHGERLWSLLLLARFLERTF